jgi:transcriptional regulator with XRE-family HTH domain
MLSFMKQGRPSTKPRTDFGQRMADARERAGLTQQQLAERLGTSQRAVAHWERDPVALRPDQIAAVADALNVSTDELLGRAAKDRAPKGPPGKLRLAFERAHKLPRHEQNQIVKFVEAYVSQYASKAS